MYEEIDTQVLVARCAPDPCDRGGEAGRRCRDVPPDIIRQLFQHPLTDKGLAQFVADWPKPVRRSRPHAGARPKPVVM